MRHISRTLAGAAIAVAAIATPAVAAHGHHDGRDRSRGAAVFVQTDATAGNQIVAYRRHRDGTLAYVATSATGGNGGTAAGASADPLASQGSLVTADHGNVLLAVNAGSNSVSVFDVDGIHLHLRQTIGSGGVFPTSIAVHDDLVYVLNAGGDGAVAGFRLDHAHLHALFHSARDLGLGNLPIPNFLTSPGQVGFTPDGSQLVITTKLSTNSIDVFGVGSNGRLSATATTTSSATPVPFAFSFGPAGQLVAAQAGGSTVSTYLIGLGGAANLIGSAGDGQTALCWITEARGFYFGSNAGSANVSAFHLDGGGAPVLVGIAGTTGTGTTDSAAAAHGHFLYVENGGAGTVDEFGVSGSGTLTKLGTVTGLPTGIEGIATIG
jgi:6-phosphogluconolactonase (cycloisomerase 2 family)